MAEEEDLGGMENLAAESARVTNASLQDRELQLIRKTTTNLESFRAKVGDDASFNKFLAAVNESNRRNESIAEFKNRLTQLGEGTVMVAAKVAQLAAKGIV